MNSYRKGFIGTFFILILIISYHFTFNKFDSNQQIQNKRKSLNEWWDFKKHTRDYKLVLLRNSHSSKKNWGYPQIGDPNFLKRAKCPEPRCRFVFSHQRKKYPLSEYDALMFDGFRVRKGQKAPEERLPYQLYIFYTTEAPARWWLKKVDLNFQYNLTLTYKPHSDIWSPFLRFIDKKTDVPISPSADVKWRKYKENFTDNKLIENVKQKKNIVAVISNCKAESKRNIIIKELKKFIDVDVYGKCGNLKCAFPKRHLKCDHSLSRKYKFFASFENKLCTDYITEKFHHAISKNMIPIVYGGSNYSRFAPPHSFIDVGDFEDFKQLAEYLKFLSETPEEYVKYFWWKKYYRVTQEGLNFCKLCEYLHMSGVEKRRKTYRNMRKLWYDDVCIHTVKSGNSSFAKKLLSGSTKNLKKNIKRLIFDLQNVHQHKNSND